MNWFEVDKDGLAKLLERRGKAFVVYELLQNAWDTDAPLVTVMLSRVPRSPYVQLVVEDESSTGWRRLSDAHTLFAESDKKGNASKRGRFNLGEKLVLAMCRRATIETGSKKVVFDETGRRTLTLKKKRAGSRFVGEIKMSEDEVRDVECQLQRLIAPVKTRYAFVAEGGAVPYAEIPRMSPVKQFSCLLPTDLADQEGVVRRVERNTVVDIYEAIGNGMPALYEMGIPVVDLPNDRWSINVRQKIPLSMERDAVSPNYLQKVHVAVLNACHDLLENTIEATAPWVRDASASPGVNHEALNSVVALRFGPRAVVHDPSDPEGTKLAASRGYTVVSGGALSQDEWTNVRKHKLLLPAGQVTPSPRAYGEGGKPEKVIPRSEYSSEGMTQLVNFSAALGKHLLGVSIQVDVVNNFGAGWGACFGDRRLALNLASLGHRWFDEPRAHEVLKLLIHEFGHHYSLDHLSSEYHDALCKLGVKLTFLATHFPAAMTSLRAEDLAE